MDGRKSVALAEAGWRRGWLVAEGIASGSEELCSATRRERADRAETRVGFSDFWKLVSWGSGDEAGWRTEQDLRGGEGLDDDHRSATLG